MNKKQYYTLTDVALNLGVHNNTARKLITSGEIKSYKIAGRYRIDAKDLAEYLKNCRVEKSPVLGVEVPE